MEHLPLGRIAALVPEFTVKDLPLGRTLMMMKIISRNGMPEQSIETVVEDMIRYCTEWKGAINRRGSAVPN